MRRLVLLICLLAAPALAQSTPSVLPPQAPILRIDAGGPSNAVTHLAVDAAGTLMAAASLDKTVRVYSLPDGVERAVLRPPIGYGHEGELYAVALSPDGQTVFAAGVTGGTWDSTFSIYVFSVAQSRLIARLYGLPSPVEDLAISPDGSMLAAGLAVGGMQVWNAKTGTPLFADSDYGGPVRAIVFSKQNVLFTSSADGKIRSYNLSQHSFAVTKFEAISPEAEVMPEPGLRAWGLAVSPDGGFVATSFENGRNGQSIVDVLHAAGLGKAFSPDTSGLGGAGLLALAWAEIGGGTSLLAAGYARDGNGNIIRRWGDFGFGPPLDADAANDTIRDMKAVPGGGVVYATEDPGWGRIGPDGGLALRPAPAVANLRTARDGGLAVSADGMAIEFKAGNTLLKFDANATTNAAALRQIAAIEPGFSGAVLQAPGLAIGNWKDTDAPTANGVSLQLDEEEYSRSVTILPDGSFLLGTDTALRHYAPDGRLLAAVQVSQAVWAVSASADGKIAVAALLDGTLQWFALQKDGSLQPRATLFVASDQRRWVLFTPVGFFDESDLGGQTLVGFHVNRGTVQQPEWISFSQAFRLFHAPAVVRAALAGDTGPEQAALAPLGDLHDRLVHEPLVAVQAACVENGSDCASIPVTSTASVALSDSADTLQLTTQITDQGRGVGALDIFVNGRNVGRQQAPAPTSAAASGNRTASATLKVPLDPGPDRIVLRQYDGSNAIYTESAPLAVSRVSIDGIQPPKSAGSLYVLAIGIDHFAALDPSLTLNFAVSDAQSFVALVKKAASPIYANAHVTLLTDTQATRAGILAALASVAAQAKPQDMFLFYVASHGGVNSADGKFLLIPQDIKDLSSWQSIEQGAIPESTLISALAKIRARDTLLFIDTCYAGNVSAASLANIGQETGRYIISASSSTQEALDSYNGHDGVMVYALRQAFDGDAPHDKQGIIGALSLGEYMSEEVGELAQEKDHTQTAEFTASQSLLNSFPVARLIGQN